MQPTKMKCFFISKKDTGKDMSEIYILWISKHLFDVPRETFSIFGVVYLSDLRLILMHII